MTMFSSGKHEKLTADPYPNVWDGHSEFNQMRADTDMYRKGAPFNFERYRTRPRPEFDRPLSNPANPILADYRGNDGHPPIDGYLRSLSPANAWQWSSRANLDEIEHARAVLSRIARLRKDT